jgi:hypothetical protein
MTRIYSAYKNIDEAPDRFDAVERALWESIVRELERFEP